mmetsp:Transcript_19893/g.43141  ORF Transcript_19893/g.43141 Transcript_19893/m.43141 type:complete len:207 (-) Transcript_19893:1251-1871(-)
MLGSRPYCMPIRCINSITDSRTRPHYTITTDNSSAPTKLTFTILAFTVFRACHTTPTIAEATGVAGHGAISTRPRAGRVIIGFCKLFGCAVSPLRARARLAICGCGLSAIRGHTLSEIFATLIMHRVATCPSRFLLRAALDCRTGPLGYRFLLHGPESLNELLFATTKLYHDIINIVNLVGDHSPNQSFYLGSVGIHLAFLLLIIG